MRHALRTNLTTQEGMRDLERRLKESGLWAKVQHGASVVAEWEKEYGIGEQYS